MRMLYCSARSPESASSRLLGRPARFLQRFRTVQDRQSAYSLIGEALERLDSSPCKEALGPAISKTPDHCNALRKAYTTYADFTHGAAGGQLVKHPPTLGVPSDLTSHFSPLTPGLRMRVTAGPSTHAKPAATHEHQPPTRSAPHPLIRNNPKRNRPPWPPRTHRRQNRRHRRVRHPADPPLAPSPRGRGLG